MILFVTALKIEADPLIRRYAMHRDMRSTAFPVFIGKEAALIISGVGKTNAAMAVVVLAERYLTIRDDVLLVSVGFCGSFDASIEPGMLVTLHKITDVESGRDFYPEICIDEKVLSCCAGCFSKIVREADFAADRPPFDVCDMESAGIISAASRYYPTHRILLLKIVSDMLKPDSLDRKTLETYMAQGVEDADRLIQQRIRSCEGGPKEALRKDELLLANLCEHLNFTVSMCHVLKKDVLACRARGMDPTNLLEAALCTEVRSKNEGKAVLQALREKLNA